MKPTAAAIVAILPTLAYAHAGAGEGFLRGFQHPLGGIDHVLVMIAVGVWAARRGSRALWLLPATFVSMIVHGAEIPADAAFGAGFLAASSLLQGLGIVLALLTRRIQRMVTWS